MNKVQGKNKKTSTQYYIRKTQDYLQKRDMEKYNRCHDKDYGEAGTFYTQKGKQDCGETWVQAIIHK